MFPTKSASFSDFGPENETGVEEITHQLYKPYRAGPRAAEVAPKGASKVPVEIVPEGSCFRVSLGATSAALGPARLIQLMGLYS